MKKSKEEIEKLVEEKYGKNSAHPMFKEFIEGYITCQESQTTVFDVDVQKLRATVSDAEFRRLLGAYLNKQVEPKESTAIGLTKEEFIKTVSKIDTTGEDEFKAEYNSPELLWKYLKSLNQKP